MIEFNFASSKTIVTAILYLLINLNANNVVILDPKIENQSVRTGLDVLIEDHRDFLSGKSIGLITNHSGIYRSGISNYLIFQETKDIKLKVIFAPEHGFYGEASAGAKVEYGKQESGPIIISLYGKNRKPTIEMLKGIDIIIYDIQDIGARFYTYISTLGMAMEVAAKKSIPLMVLDRPNPLGGLKVEGAILDTNYKSFVGYYPIPTRYGMTVGELSFMAKSKKWLDCKNLDLIIVKMDNWNRKMYFDDTKLKWIPPSPNIPDLKTAIIYPGMCLFEATNVSEGRGTNNPFSIIGAPWIDEKFSEKFNNSKISGTKIIFKSFKPISIKGKSENPKHLDAFCNGIILNITNRDSFQPIKTALKAIMLAREIYPLDFIINETNMKKLWGNGDILDYLNGKISEKQIKKILDQGIEKFKEQRQPFLLYN